MEFHLPDTETTLKFFYGLIRLYIENDLKTNIDDREQETKERVNKQMKDHAKKQNDTLDHRFDN